MVTHPQNLLRKKTLDFLDLGCTVAFIRWKIQDRRQIKNTDNTQTKHNRKSKHKTQQKQNYPGLVAFYVTRPGNKVGLFCNAPEPTKDHPSNRQLAKNRIQSLNN